MALTKAVIINREAPAPVPIPIMFNPPSYSLTKTNQFAEIRIPGLPTAILQYVSGEAQVLSTELFFDTTDAGSDVRARTGTITDLLKPDPVTQAPPRLLLLWGSLMFQCVLISVRADFDRFNSGGIPMRARLQVEFKGWDDLSSSPGAVLPASPGEPGQYIAKAGESLAQIAAATFGDPSQWRRIADANDIDDPRTLPSGTTLRIPGLF